MQVSPNYSHRRSDHILRHLYFERLSAALGIDRSQPCFTASGMPSYELLTDGPDEVIFLQQRQLAIAAQALDDAALTSFRGKLARILKLDVLTLDLTYSHRPIAAELVIAVPWQAEPASYQELVMWLGSEGEAALVPADSPLDDGEGPARCFMLDLDPIGIVADLPFTTQHERADGIARAIAFAAAASSGMLRS